MQSINGAYQIQQCASLFISLSNCAYLKALLALFPAAEKKDDYNTLATLASIIKTIFLFNEPGIIQLIASDGNIFEDCCCCLEYDPDLRSKANHRWFIRDRLKFRTVVFMEVSTYFHLVCQLIVPTTCLFNNDNLISVMFNIPTS